MGKYATRKTLAKLCAYAGFTLYSHQLDSNSFQYYAGGYVVNGYLGLGSIVDMKYEMQKMLLSRLKYGGGNSETRYRYGTIIRCCRTPNAILPLTHPLHDRFGDFHTLHDIKADAKIQEYLDLQNS